MTPAEQVEADRLDAEIVVLWQRSYGGYQGTQVRGLGRVLAAPGDPDEILMALRAKGFNASLISIDRGYYVRVHLPAPRPKETP